jgi:energy-converting hydrogenase A subunit M
MFFFGIILLIEATKQIKNFIVKHGSWIQMCNIGCMWNNLVTNSLLNLAQLMDVVCVISYDNINNILFVKNQIYHIKKKHINERHVH